MEHVNKVILLGNMGRDPCIKYLSDGYTDGYFSFNSEVLAANRLTMLTLREYIKSCLTAKMQPVVRQTSFKFLELTKAIGFFSTKKVNLRNAP